MVSVVICVCIVIKKSRFILANRGFLFPVDLWSLTNYCCHCTRPSFPMCLIHFFSFQVLQNDTSSIFPMKNYRTGCKAGSSPLLPNTQLWLKSRVPVFHESAPCHIIINQLLDLHSQSKPKRMNYGKKYVFFFVFRTLQQHTLRIKFSC